MNEEVKLGLWLAGLQARKFEIGDRVRKKGKGGSWQGHVCGFYSTPVTPIGYNVASEREVNSVQIYLEAALEPVPDGE